MILTLKYIIVGNSGIGKSCILSRLLDKEFLTIHDSTIGVEFGNKVININNDKIKLQIWDTAGQETFRSISKLYYRNTICALLVFDITSNESFQTLESWYDDLKYNDNSDMLIILVGNKSDLSSQRVISYDEALKFANDHNMKYYETSAKTDQNIDEIFLDSAKEIYDKLSKKSFNIPNNNSAVKIINQNNPININNKSKFYNICCYK